MKKVLLTLAIILGTTTVSVLRAQDSGSSNTNYNNKKYSFGVKADANLSNHLLSDMDNTKSKLGFGVSAGGFFKYDFHPNFAIQPEIMVHYKTSKLENKLTKAESDFEYWGLEIPVYGLYQTGLGSGRGYIGLGPYVGVGLSAELGDVDQYEEIAGNKQMQRWDFGAGAIVGYEFNFGLQINATYKMGFIDALDQFKDNATIRNQTISLGLAYRF